MDSAPRHDGTQSIARAIALLKAIASRPRTGWRAADLAAHCALDDGTVRRVLRRLVKERAVHFDLADRRYRPGALLFELGLAPHDQRALQAICQPLLLHLSRVTGATALLYLRAGAEFVCAGREGPPTSNWLAVQVGTRRSLGLSQPERGEMLADCARHAEERGPVRAARFQQIVARSLRHGAGVNLGDGVPGVTALAVAIHRTGGQPVAAIGLSGPLDQFDASKVPAMLELLQAQARSIEREACEVLDRL